MRARRTFASRPVATAARTLRVAAALILAFAATACDDGESTDPMDTASADTTMDGTADTTAPDTTPIDVNFDMCCTPTECAANGELCNATTCLCEPAPAQCVSAGESCTPDEATNTGFACVDTAAGDGVCRRTCTLDHNCTVEGEACVGFDSGSFERWCQPDECAGFFADDCASGRCAPAAPGVDVCIPAGSGAVLDACTTHTECGADLICSAGRCLEPACTTDGGTACTDAGSQCEPMTVNGRATDLGICAEACTAFVTPSGCAGGDWCKPVEKNGQVYDGVCVPAIGQQAGSETCTADLDCIEGFVCRNATCRAVCDPEASILDPGFCPSTIDECVPVLDGTPFVTDWGVCLRACEPFSNNSGCFGNEWCVPNVFTGDSHCEATSGQVGEGEFCLGESPTNTCAEGKICLQSLDCRTACDPFAEAGAEGESCPGDTGCVTLYDFDGELAPAGFCSPSCDYHGGTRGCDTDPVRGFCAMGEAFQLDFDPCTFAPSVTLPPDGDCRAAGLNPYTLCGPNSVCVPNTETNALVCKDVCAVSEAPYGTTGHPDCRNPAQTCEAFFGPDSVGGVCF